MIRLFAALAIPDGVAQNPKDPPRTAEAVKKDTLVRSLFAEVWEPNLRNHGSDQGIFL